MPPKLSISRFFAEQLGAPFRNIRWSWGSLDEKRKRVFLRLWADDRARDAPRIRILEKLLAFDPRPGLSERRRHVELIRGAGYSAFGILCERDGPGRPIRDYNSKSLLRLGALVDDAEFVHATIIGEASIADLDEVRP